MSLLKIKTGKEQSIVIKASSGLSDEDIEKMIKDAEANAEEDKKFEGLVQAKNNADMLIHATTKSINESGTKLTDAEKASVDESLAMLEEAVKSDDLTKIEDATKALNEKLTPLAQKLYSAPNGDEAVDPSANQSNDSDDNTVEAEYEEVKEDEDKS